MSNSISYCTLFDSSYLDKGLAMCLSLRRFNSTAPLVVLAMNDRAREVLIHCGLPGVIVIGLTEIEAKFPALPQVKHTRSFGEYCWTITPFLIDFSLELTSCNIATYLDSDLWFFENPDILNEEFIKSGAVTMVMPHRFPDTVVGRRRAETYGRYCVEFNSFYKQPDSLKLLRWWEDRVLETCEYNRQKGLVGDQKYLERFEELGEPVYVCQNLGGGLAPWNLGQYTLKGDNCGLLLEECNSGIRFIPIFYHYQNIKYLGKRAVNISVGRAEPSVKRAMYSRYLAEIQAIRASLAKDYGVHFSGNRFVYRHRFAAWIQKYLTRFILRDFSISDIMFLPR